MDKIDPKLYRLPARTVLLKDDHDNFVLYIDRKSRIIMKDASVILEKAEKIRKTAPGVTIKLETTAPVCSKSTKFLSDNGIEIISKK
ncbi:MAG: hypothetical protein PHG14_03065 [Desulfobacter postgatei]|uniref:Uncharacterized protein n=1 Tax=Desulfobacter postgatei 2ac9 TaxID=879212 RepID=I5B688_9BACT|nr:hypothetical protein [Desulfobacter postgatei]EIM65001.1 hypothetical protein DespoDRAFT_03220 [Desulfobacter postgatei 2ac9]MDD4272688.1 hypothetical protein [Desulfobacter postgatei]